jgi:hypothetical protein
MNQRIIDFQKAVGEISDILSRLSSTSKTAMKSSEMTEFLQDIHGLARRSSEYFQSIEKVLSQWKSYTASKSTAPLRFNDDVWRMNIESLFFDREFRSCCQEVCALVSKKSPGIVAKECDDGNPRKHWTTKEEITTPSEILDTLKELEQNLSVTVTFSLLFAADLLRYGQRQNSADLGATEHFLDPFDVDVAVACGVLNAVKTQIHRLDGLANLDASSKSKRAILEPYSRVRSSSKSPVDCSMNSKSPQVYSSTGGPKALLEYEYTSPQISRSSASSAGSTSACM